ncbi:CDP-diacylglycerol--serine O-phosphatidyltransferase [candidate division KSB1 bacterium]|nr:CDP-diacylglycerol--serine O-phosphatidyltransferase [candidate division KSB1 bacterium]
MKFNITSLPSLFTCLNLFFGFAAIIQISTKDFETAAWFIIIAVLFDGMDGKLARWTGTGSAYGFEMDSLADLVSFGVAPAFLVYSSGLKNFGFIGLLIAFFYLLAGLYRLARFNVLQAGDRTKGYTGLPIPVSGMTVAAFELFRVHMMQSFHDGFLVSILAILSILMVSTVPYDWPALQFHESLYLKFKSIFILICVVSMALLPNWCLFPILSLFILFGIVEWIYLWIHGDVTASQFFHVIRSH